MGLKRDRFYFTTATSEKLISYCFFHPLTGRKKSWKKIVWLRRRSLVKGFFPLLLMMEKITSDGVWRPRLLLCFEFLPSTQFSYTCFNADENMRRLESFRLFPTLRKRVKTFNKITKSSKEKCWALFKASGQWKYLFMQIVSTSSSQKPRKLLVEIDFSPLLHLRNFLSISNTQIMTSLFLTNFHYRFSAYWCIWRC